MALLQSLSESDTGAFVTVAPDASGSFVVPDDSLLFGAEFQRSGPDLLLLNEGHPTLHLPGYFAAETPADIFVPNGAVLKGHLAEVLAGPEAPGQYAQVGVVEGANPIGQVETLAGSATVRRADGTQEGLGPETKIFLGDLVETGPGAAVSLTFVDGTIFSLSANTRMVIDELVYDPNGTDNSATFNLIEGGFVFIAGQIAPTGGIDLNTPTATMGIRGTTVLVDISTVNGIVTVQVQLLEDADGSVGRILLFDLSGTLIAEIDTTDIRWEIRGDGTEPREIALVPVDEAETAELIAEAFLALQTATTRVEGGGSYVTLDSLETLLPPSAPSPGTQPSELGVDSIDDAPGVPDSVPAPPPPAAPPQNNNNSIQEEGSLDLPGPPLAPTVAVAGLEDQGGGSLAGQIPSGAGGSGPVTFSLVAGPQNGDVDLAGDGTFSYTPDPDFNGEDQFTYQVTGPDGQSATGEVTFVIQAVNDAPEAPDVTKSVAEDGSISGVIAGSDVDGDPLTYSLLTAPQNGTVVVTETGGYSYTPNPDFAGEDSFVVSVQDGLGGQTSATVVVSVANVNDPPVITSPPEQLTAAVSEDATANASGQLSVQDLDAGDALVWSGDADGAVGTFQIDPQTGSWTYSLTDQAQALGAGETVTEVFEVSVTDADGASDTQTVTITVLGTNDVPVIEDVVLRNEDSGGVSGMLSADDADAGDVPTFSLGDVAPQNGVVDIAADGQFTYTPDAGFRGQDSFTYRVEDGQGGEAQATVRVLVEGDSGEAPGDQVITIEIDPTGGDPDLPGVISVARTPAIGNAVNIGLVLDWSSSVDTGDISSMVAAVSQALSDLSARFAGSETAVDVHLVALSPTGFLRQTFDLQEIGALRETLAEYDFSAQALPLALSVAFAETFFKSQPAAEANYLYIVTPADAADLSAAGAVAAVQDSAANGFEVAVEAFIYGDTPNAATVDVLDATPITLTGSESITGLDSPQPIFNAVLVDLSVGLFADGADRGEIANESSDAIVETADGLSLNISDIPSIESLLGSENILTVEAGFDLDGDRETVELTLYSSAPLETPTAPDRSVAAFDIEGDLTGALLSLAATTDVEVVDIDNDLPNVLTLTGENVKDLSDSTDALLDRLLGDPPENTVTIYGDGGDTLTLVSGAEGVFSESAEAPVRDEEGTELALYNYTEAGGVTATIAVDADVAVTIATATASA